MANGLISEGDALVLANRPAEAHPRYTAAYDNLAELNEPLAAAQMGLWNSYRQTAFPLNRLSGLITRASTFAVSTDGRTAISSGDDETLRLWDLAGGQELRSFSVRGEGVALVAISPDGRSVLAGCKDYSLKLWDLTNERKLHTFTGHTEAITVIAFSPDGRTALSGSHDSTLKLWDLKIGKELRTFKGHTSGVLRVTIARDGRTATSTDAEWTTKVWDLATGNEVSTFTARMHERDMAGAEQPEEDICVALAADGRTALSGSTNGTLQLWDLATGKVIRNFSRHNYPVMRGMSPAGVLCVAFAPDGRTALSGSFDHSLTLWEISNGKVLRTFAGHADRVTHITIAPDGRTAAFRKPGLEPGSKTDALEPGEGERGAHLDHFARWPQRVRQRLG